MTRSTTRRTSIAAALAVVLGLAPSARTEAKVSEVSSSQSGGLWVYIGTYTARGSEGIYRCEMDPKSGKLSNLVLVAKTPNPTFLGIHPSGRYLVAVNEIDNFEDTKGGSATSYTIDTTTGALTKLNARSTGGAGSCHITFDHAGAHILVANYHFGSTAVLPIAPSGMLGRASSFVKHEGKGPNAARQEAAHAHSANLDPSGRFLVVADLGQDKVIVYKYDAAAGTITPNSPDGVSMAPGAGPRHLSFHPNGRFAYVCNELDSTVTAMSYDASTGTFTKLDTLSTLPSGPVEGNSTAEVRVHPSGKFVYVSNRGHNSIACYSVDEKTGKLKPIGNMLTGGRTPRNFNFDPTGKFLVAANQDSSTITVFRLDPKTGLLSYTGYTIDAPMPVCIKFLAKS